jgi:hypothetical protein
MYDNFPPLQVVDLMTQQIRPNHFKIYENQQVVQAGDCNGQMVLTNNKNHYIFTVDKMEGLQNYLDFETQLVYDKAITQNDRIQLVILPIQSNISSNSINLLKMNIGSTRDNFTFTPGYPVVVSFFFKNLVIHKVSLTMENPVRLIEFF